MILDSFVNDLDEAIGQKPVMLYKASGDLVGSFEVEELWEHKGRPVVKFAGVDTITSAEELEGCEIRIPKAERPSAPEDEYYHDDLVGCMVVEAGTGKAIGTVAAWGDYGGGGVLEIDNGVMIPFARSICVEIDVASKRIRVNLPDGLLDLN